MRAWQMRKAGMLPVVYMEFAAGASTVGGGDAGGGSGAGGETGAGAGGGAGAGAGSSAGTPGAGAGATPDWNASTVPAQLRDGYNKLKADYDALNKQYEPWKGLNLQPNQVTQFQQGYQQVYGEMKGIADRLQISEAEIADAVKAHGLVKVLDQLRYESEQAEAAASGDQGAIDARELEERIQAIADAKLSPVLQRENKRMVAEANTLVENTITTLATDAFKAAGMDFAGAPPELKNFVLTGVTEALKYDDDGMKAIKFEGKTAAIQRAFQTFQAMWDAAYLARRSMEGRVVARPGQQQQRQQQQGQPKQPTIDEIINNPDSVRAARGLPAYST